MMKNIIAASVLTLSLSACVAHENHPPKPHERHDHISHEHDYRDDHYDGYPYDRKGKFCPPGQAKKGRC